MAVVTVTTSFTALTAAESSGSDPVSVMVQLKSGAADVYLDTTPAVTADDTATGGVILSAGQSMAVDIPNGTRLYGIVAASTQAIRVLRTGAG